MANLFTGFTARKKVWLRFMLANLKKKKLQTYCDYCLCWLNSKAKEQQTYPKNIKLDTRCE